MRMHAGRIGGLLLILFLAVGCAKGPPPNFYLLDAGAPTHMPGFEAGTAVGVGPVAMAPHLDRNQIVSRETANKLKVSERSQWAEPLQAGFTRVLLVNLGLELDSNRIYELPSRQRRPLDYQVAIDVLRFDGTLGGNVILGARWQLMSGNGRQVLASKVSRIDQTVTGATYDDFVSAQGRAVVALSQEIAAAIKLQLGS